MSFPVFTSRQFGQFSVLLLSGLLAACQSNSDSGAAASTGTGPAATTPATAPVPASSPGAWYRQYRGVLPGQPDSITLQLHRWPQAAHDSESAGVAASYAGPDGHTFELYGQASAASDSITLTDSTPEHAGPDYARSIAWRLKLEGTSLTGTVGGQPVRLRQVQPAGSLQFAARFFADSVAAFPEAARTPYARQRMLVLLPAGGVAGAAAAALRNNLLRNLGDDSTGTQPVLPPEKLWAQRMQRYRDDYRQDVEANKPEPGDTTTSRFGLGLSYDEQQLMHVLWNQAPLLSVGYYGYSYTGGAHGIYGTSAATFDTRTGRQLRYHDIFRAGTKARLVPILDNAARRTLGLAPGAPLDRTLFVKHLPATSNVFLTSGGATFIYMPYEIASYAQGEIRLFVPFAELQPLLKPGLPVPGGGEVSRQ